MDVVVAPSHELGSSFIARPSHGPHIRLDHYHNRLRVQGYQVQDYSFYTRRTDYYSSNPSSKSWNSNYQPSESSAFIRSCHSFRPADIIEPPAPLLIRHHRAVTSRRRYSWEMDAEQKTSSEADTTPELSISSSKSSATSSCSSSLRSVSFPDDETRDTVDFEDINLADDTKCITPNTRRPLLRTAKTACPSTSPRSSWSSNDGLRQHASRNHHARNLRQPPSPRHSWNRSPTSPSMSLSPPSASRPFPTQRTQSTPMSPSPRSPLSPRLHSDIAPMLPSKRLSWNPNKARKTAKEIEAEYDELDEDLPEDAIVWNVPCLRPVDSRSTASLSPPSQSRKSRISASVSPRRSSPERGDLKERGPPVHKVKSWDEVMRELSDDARKLTATLEYRHDNIPTPMPTRSMSKRTKSAGKQAEIRPTLHTAITSPDLTSTSFQPPPPIQNAENAATPRPALKTDQRTQTIALPTMQTLSPALDPVPASKEKERFLTLTRPSWLPPKSAKEERKHLREWEKMMRRNGAEVAVP